MDEAITGLAALAFLSAGHTEKSGMYKNVVRKAVAHLVASQSPEGEIGGGRETDPRVGCNHALGGLALVLAYDMGGVPETGVAARRALDWSTKHYQTENGGWSRWPGGEADIRMTCWFLLQLSNARPAKLEVSQSAFDRSRIYLDHVIADIEHG
ncbi:MAG: hypothetical protein ACYSU0_08145, partial [Planctomycetota bacterium]